MYIYTSFLLRTYILTSTNIHIFYLFIHSGTYIGTSMNAEWTLVAKDLKYDTLEVRNYSLYLYV